jgi:hypothetical protein
MDITASGWMFDLPLLAASDLAAPKSSDGVTPSSRKQILDWQRSSWDDELHAIKDLTNDWDGYGASLVDRNAIALASSLLQRLQTIPTHILPTPTGTLLLEWESIFGRASLELGKSRFGFYAAPTYATALYRDGVIDELDVNELEHALTFIDGSVAPHSISFGD